MPSKIEQSLTEIYDRRAPIYGTDYEGNGWKLQYTEPADPIILDEIRRTKPQGEFSCLDLGCADGARMALLKKKGGALLNNAKFYGADSSPEMIRHATKSGLYAEVRVNDIRERAFPEHTFDYTFLLFSVLNHLLQDHEQAISNIAASLSPRGIFIFDIFGMYTYQHDFPRDPEWSHEWSDRYAEHLIKTGKMRPGEYNQSNTMFYPNRDNYDASKGVENELLFLRMFNWSELEKMLRPHFRSLRVYERKTREDNFSFTTTPEEIAYYYLIVAEK